MDVSFARVYKITRKVTGCKIQFKIKRQKSILNKKNRPFL